MRKYQVKMYDEETILIDNIFDTEEAFEYAKRHNFNVFFTETTSCDSIYVMKLFQDAGYEIILKKEKCTAPDGMVLEPKIVAFFKRREQLEKITIKEYNTIYFPKIERASIASSYEQINNALYKCNDHDGAMKQLEVCLGLSKETEETIRTALKLYKEHLYSRFEDIGNSSNNHTVLSINNV